MQADAGPVVGRPAPDFALRDAHGRVIALSSFRGHTTVLGFFCACDRCHRAAKQLAGLQHEGAVRRFVAVVALAPAEATAFQKETGFTGTVLTDESDQVQEQYQSGDCPRFWVVSPTGKLTYGSDTGLEGVELGDALQAVKEQSAGGKQL